MNPSIGSLDFLFTTFEGGGAVSAMIAVATRLAGRGHAVRFMSDECNRAEAEHAGLEFIPWITAPGRTDKTAATDFARDWEPASPEAGFVQLRDRLMCGPAAQYATDVVNAIRTRAPDLIVSNDLLMGPAIAAQATERPFVLFGPNISLYPLPGLPPVGPGLLPAETEADRAQHAAIAAAIRALLNGGLPAVNAARAAFQLPPIDDVMEQLEAAECYLLATSPAFDFPSASPSPSSWMRYVGPELADPAWAHPWQSPWSDTDERPLDLIAFSTSYQNHLGVLERIAAALGDLPVRAVLTMGPGLAGHDLRAPSNVAVCESAPHGPLMRDARLVITHGGHGTIVRALVAGVPLLCIPVGRDQGDNTVRVTARNAGIGLPPTASSEEIRSAVNTLLQQASYREAARQLGARIADDAARSTVVEELESRARARRLASAVE